MSKKHSTNTGIVADSLHISEIFGIETGTLSTWVAEGLPVVQEKPRKINTKDAIQWYKDREIAKKVGPRLDTSQELAKKTQVQTELLKQELLVRTNKLVSADEIIEFWTSLINGVKFNLLNIPKSVAQQFDGITSDSELENLLIEQITAALETLSKGFDIDAQSSDLQQV